MTTHPKAGFGFMIWPLQYPRQRFWWRHPEGVIVQTSEGREVDGGILSEIDPLRRMGCEVVQFPGDDFELRWIGWRVLYLSSCGQAMLGSDVLRWSSTAAAFALPLARTVKETGINAFILPVSAEEGLGGERYFEDLRQEDNPGCHFMLHVPDVFRVWNAKPR